MAEETILLSHGNGGTAMHKLITGVFMEAFGNPVLRKQSDSAVVSPGGDDLAFSTDSFVIDPLVFPGGDIGKLAVCGTVNDLAVSGAEPLYLSAAFIIEEGFPMETLRNIVTSMAAEAKRAGVWIVTGDTKVVNRGKCDKLFINTSGVGRIVKKNRMDKKTRLIKPGDCILINGNIGDHGIAVLNAREGFRFRTPVVSDCASLNRLIALILDNTRSVKFMRDPTRGGAATVLNELAGRIPYGIELEEELIPVGRGVMSMCEILGFDPLYVANEGKVIMVVSKRESVKVMEIMKRHTHGKHGAIIGKIVRDHPGRVVLHTITGGRRIVDALAGDPLPRIC